jgi:RimJ/RimL family protein N-acetyltransferase
MRGEATEEGVPLPIVGTKVMIRKLLKKDLGSLYTLEADKDVKRYVGGPVTKPREEWVEEMRRKFARPLAILPLTVISKSTGRFAGRATLVPDAWKTCWEIQVLIAKMYWGQRLGREVTALLMSVAFHHLKASSIIGIVDPNNKASRELADTLGFRHIETKQSGHLVYQRERDAAREPSNSPPR